MDIYKISYEILIVLLYGMSLYRDWGYIFYDNSLVQIVLYVIWTSTLLAYFLANYIV